MKILIAEDSPTSRKLLQRVLEKCGHEIIATADGSQALKEFQNDPELRLAILDWMMPEMSGVEACRKIKNDPDRAFTYVIMLTAKTQKDDIVEALEAGADDFVSKPFDASELKARVNAGIRIVDLQSSLSLKIAELEQALTHVKQLQGILPMCAWCKKIRDDDNYWNSVEDYFHKHSDTEFSHGICPDCRDKVFAQELEES